MWVDPEFKKMIKANSALEGISVTEYTRRVSQSDLFSEVEEFKKKKRRFGFDF